MSWWTRQRIPMIALAVTAVAAVGVHVWLDVIPSMPDTPKVVAAVDDEAAIAGQQLELDAVHWDEYDAPAGSRTLSIRLDARAGADPSTCGAFTLSETSGPRVWRNARSALDVPYDDGETGCEQEPGGYRILAVFLLPDDAAGPFDLDVPDSEGHVARFRIEP